MVALPAGVKAVWDVRAAWRETTPTRERVSLNGLWRWQPAENSSATVPATRWGWFKVPGCWPGLRDYMQNESQTVFAHPGWKDTRYAELSAAWYQREFAIPADWAGRRIALALETLNSFAAVYIDGVKAGEITFPGGELELPSVCAPGGTHVLSLLVIGMPLKAVMLSYGDSARAKEVRGDVERRGLCGDAWLVSTPRAARVTDVRVATSVRRSEITFDVALAGLDPAASYRLSVQVTAGGKKLKSFTGGDFTAADLKGGRWSFTAGWKTDRIWDTDTPANQEDAAVVLETAKGRSVDAAFPVRFGFREFWIEGREMLLNGTPVHVAVLPVDNNAVSALASTYGACRETFARMQAAGYNAVYTHNYGTDPGTHLAFREMLSAADDAGMLVFFSMPHFGNYEWKGADADAANGYTRHAEAYVRVAQNHPAVVLYVMSHNGCGYEEDMNPDLMANENPPRGEWGARGAAKALRCEAIVRALDPSRLVYHHSAGDLGSMDTVNFYGNHMPATEMAEWMEPWAARGTKPAILIEFGAPLSWDWTMYRGWYRGEREFGSGNVPWEFCVAEWNSQYLGDAGFAIEEVEARNLVWEAEQFRTSKGWHRWDYPAHVGSPRFTAWLPIFARILSTQLRGMRTSGISGYCVWDDGLYWHARDGVDRDPRPLPVEWDRLQRPGFSPDFADSSRFQSWRITDARADWVPTVAGDAIVRNNRPLLAWLAGSATGFASAEHVYAPGETVAKQLIVINDSRRRVTADCSWSLALPQPVAGTARVAIEPGGQVRLPVAGALPAALTAGRYVLSATVAFSTGETQTDTFDLDVLAFVLDPLVKGRVAVFDPAGETVKLLADLHVAAESVGADASLKNVDILVIGRHALSPDGPAPDLARVRDGLKVVVFEQTQAALEKRLGFRAVEYGLRQVFRRVPGHAALAGLDEAVLHDWRGSATSIPPRLDYRLEPMHGPTVDWCGIPVSRVWRCGTRGNVASVLIEKPARGDFLPILDGGFSLQYAPLMEYREGKGLVVFCQMDVTGRSDADPAAGRLVRNILGYVSGWTPSPRRTIAYAGEPSGSRWLESAGFAVRRYAGGKLKEGEILVVGPGAPKKAVPPAGWLGVGGRLVAVGLDWKDANAIYPPGVRMKSVEHINAVFDPPAPDSPLAGVGPADVHDRSARNIPLVDQGPLAVGDGVLATAFDGRVVFDQLAPWQFEPGDGLGLRRTYRRVSFLLNRLLANMGAGGATPLLERFGKPAGAKETRYLSGLYLDQPIEWDDPYRFFRW
ncbi:MAG: glycoside hydrolase family 2 TIM barrel-domain containing protein [Candidatus Coatesbacteria bacterium]